MKEEIIINMKLEQDEGAFAKLAQLKSSITNLKEEAKNLQTAYKNGSITLKEFSSESVRVEALMKKHSATYNQVQRSVTGLKNPFDNVTNAIKEQTAQLNVGGISLTKFLNPVTGVAAGLGALYTAYKNSTTGAKDLEFASNQLAAANMLLSNSFFELFSSAEDGQGFFSKMADSLLFKLNPSLAIASNTLAMMNEQLQDARREEIQVRADNQARLEQNQELQTAIAETAVTQLNYNEKMRQSNEIITNLKMNQDNLIKVKEKELGLLQSIAKADPNNEAKQEAALNAAKDLNRERARSERLIQSAQRAEDNLTQSLEKSTKASKDKNAEDAERNKNLKMQVDFERELSELAEEEDKFNENQAELEKIKSDNFNARWAEHVATVKAANEQMDEDAQEAFDKDLKRQQQKAVFSQIFLKEFSSLFQQQLKINNDFSIAMVKTFIITSLHAFKKYIELKILGESFATADSILSFGLTGSIRAGVMLGLIEAAFAGFEGVISGFAEGGNLKPISGTRVNKNHGVPIRRANGDNRLITVKSDAEAVINEQQIQRLGGPRAMAAAGIPGFIGGGALETRSAASSAIADMTMQRLLSSMDKLRVAVIIEEVESLSAIRAEIRERATT